MSFDNKDLQIHLYCENNTIYYAAQEMGKYLEIMTSCQTIEIIHKQNFEKATDNGIHIGLLQEFGVSSLGVQDSFLDDEIYINICNGNGIIAGNSPRSVLISAYRMLAENGCIWIRPGSDGECIPKKHLNDINACIHEKPSYRHRGIDFIGDKSREDILDLICWAPKVGFNTIFFEGLYPYQTDFFKTWYNHFGNPLKKPENLSIQTLKDFYEEAIVEIKKRDLIYHGAGHGFNCEPLGLDPNYKGEIDEQVKTHIAIVNGKREILRNACATNLCYSNPITRKKLVDYMVNYAKENRQIDFMHIWLADGINNHCECDNCKNVLPSDLYIKMLNELDEQLTKKEISMRIVLISYTDLIWKPAFEKLNNKQRFTLTHAPHFRSYRKSFKDVGKLPELPKYNRNANEYPVSIEENVAYINDWNDYFGGDNFFFEYPFWVAQYADPGQYKISKILYEDITSLKELGVNGYISCQQVKSFMPVGLGMYIMGKTLWNDSLPFDEMVKEYYKSAFGEDWDKCLEYMKTLSKLFDPDHKGEKGPIKKEDYDRYSQVICKIENFRDIIEKNTSIDNICQSVSWNYLELHANMTTLLALAYQNKALNNNCSSAAVWRMLEQYIQEHEDEMKKVFDTYTYIRSQRHKFISEGK